MKIIMSLVALICAYLYGSIPFALVVGKLFFHKDIRTEGSHNLGGTNAGRVLGKRIGLLVIVLDATKCIVAILFTRWLMAMFGLRQEVEYLAGLSCIIGHCYPVFAEFKGGKGVSSAIAYAFMTNIFGFLVGLVVFMTTLKLTKYVSLSSIIGSTSILLASPFVGYPPFGIFVNACIVVLIIYKHHENIDRLRNGTESKITWM